MWLSLTFPIHSKFRLFRHWKMQSHFSCFSNPSGSPAEVMLASASVEMDNNSYQKAMTRTRVMTVICINLLLQTPASASVEPWRWWWWCFFGGRSRFDAADDDVFLVGGKLLHRLEKTLHMSWCLSGSSLFNRRLVGPEVSAKQTAADPSALTLTLLSVLTSSLNIVPMVAQMPTWRMGLKPSSAFHINATLKLWCDVCRRGTRLYVHSLICMKTHNAHATRWPSGPAAFVKGHS